MTKLSFNILFVILTIVHSISFFIVHGSYGFGLFYVIMYLVVNYLYFKNQDSFEIVSFEFLFFISFFFSCVIFPIIPLEKSELYWAATIFGEISDKSKWRFLNMALVGYYLYMLGLQSSKKQLYKKGEIRNLIINNSFLSVSNTLTLLFIMIFYLTGGFHLMNRYSGEVGYFTQFGGYLAYITMLYTISSAVVMIKIGQSSNPSLSLLFSPKYLLFVINSLLILPLLFFSGYRSQFLQLFIPLVYLYVFFIKKINNRKMLLIILIGFLGMILIGMTRGGSKATGGHDFAYYIRDFIIEDVAGVWLVDYTDTYGSTGGSNAILSMVSFIPFLGGFLKELIGDQNFATASSYLFTYAYETNGSGLGTNMIGDLYYSFGFFGVVFFMFIFGFFIRKVSSHGGLYSLVCYLLMIGDAVFATRVEFFYMVRTIGLSMIIIWLISQFTGKLEYINKS